MWFKRRKKSEQDQALSQSLKSLQTLLNETDRREPSLDNRSSGPDTTGDDVPAPPRTPEALKPRATRRPGTPAGEPGRGQREPAPPDSTNRWRDLNLAFDAEPAPPRPRRQPDTEVRQEPSPDEPPAEDEPDAKDAVEAQDEAASPEAAALEEADPAEPELDEAQADEPSAAEPRPDEPPAGPAAEPNDSATRAPAPAPVDEPDAEEASEVTLYEPGELDRVEPRPPRLEVAPVELESFSPRPPVEEPEEAEEEDSDAVETLTISDTLEPPPLEDEEEAAVMEEPSLPPFQAPDDEEANVEAATPPATPAGEGGARDREEDQLHLELERTDEDAEDDIPTLTEAVYVPDTAPAPPVDATEPEPLEAAGPAGTQSAQDTTPATGSVEWCIEQLRTRLEVMKIDPLSPEQETELRDTLSELLDELKYPDAGD